MVDELPLHPAQGARRDRIDKRPVRTHITSALHKLIRVLAAEEDSTIEALVHEALQRAEATFRARLKKIRDSENSEK